MRKIFVAIQTLKEVNLAPLEKSISEFEQFTGQVIPEEAIVKFKFAGLDNVDLFTSSFLNQFGLKNILQFIKDNPSSKTHHSKKRKIERIKTYSVDFIFDFIRNNQNAGFYVDEQGNQCKLRRARIFEARGIKCTFPGCNNEGSFFALERWGDDSFHFDLYGKDDVGDEVLMTVDHVHAKSNGGPDHLSNFETMCKCCNEIKSDF